MWTECALQCALQCASRHASTLVAAPTVAAATDARAVGSTSDTLSRFFFCGALGGRARWEGGRVGREGALGG